jgi:AcrR family transcriptional regulator
MEMCMVDNAMTQWHVFSSEYKLPLVGEEDGTKARILNEATVLFAQNGYEAVSVRMIAEGVGITPAALYNHFESKERLWDAVLTHAADIYKLYLHSIDKELKKCESFAAAIEVIFHEPVQMRNDYTTYAFALINAQQLWDEAAAKIFGSLFMEYSVEFFSGWFQHFIDLGWASDFDTTLAAEMIMSATFIAINLTLHHYAGRESSANPSDMLTRVQRRLLVFDIARPGVTAAV